MTILKPLLAVAAAMVLLVGAWRIYVHFRMPALVERYGKPVDFATLKRSDTANDWLRALDEDAPTGRPEGPPLLLPQAAPIVVKTIETLFGDRILMRRPNGQGGADFALVERTRLMRFPDFVTLSVRQGPHGTRVLAYSHSVYGQRDFGVNRARVEGMFQVLDEAR